MRRWSSRVRCLGLLRRADGRQSNAEKTKVQELSQPEKLMLAEILDWDDFRPQDSELPFLIRAARAEPATIARMIDEFYGGALKSVMEAKARRKKDEEQIKKFITEELGVEWYH